MIQKLFQVEFVTEQDVIVARFFPIVNKSQRQRLNELYKDEPYSSLEVLNLQGYELHGFFTVYDDKSIPHQIAIFTSSETNLIN